MTLSKKRQIAWIAVFIALIFLPQVAFLMFGKYADNTNHEKRELAQKPIMSISSYKEYSSDYENYYNDHIPFRNELIKAHNFISYKIFNKSESDNVVIGKEGWLFFDNEEEGDPIKEYQRMLSFADIELEKIARNIMALSKYADDNGIPFILFIAPNKEGVYSEYLPDYITVRSDNPTRCEQLTAYLEANTNIKIVNPYETLKAYKQDHPEYKLYYKQDTHWTRLGAYIATQELLKAIGIDIPDIENTTISDSEAGQLDLIELLNLTSIISNEADYKISDYGESPYTASEMEFTGNYRMSCEEAVDNRKIFVIRDSFALNMSEYIASYFSETIMPHRTYSYTPQMLEEEKPDIIVLETAERYLYQLMGGFLTEEDEIQTETENKND